jgi:beta-glucosidase
MPRLLLVAPLVLAVGCGGGGGSPTTDSLDAYCQGDHVAIEARIDAWLAELTLEQKATLMAGSSLIPTQRVWRASALTALGIPGFRMLDGPRGVSYVSQVPASVFPVGMARGATWDPELERRVGSAMGRELRAVGADVLLAPTINIVRHPRWGRTQESYSEDPLHMGDLAVAFIQGAQEHVLASAKHFAGNSIEATRYDVDVTIDERTLREIYLPHFRRAVQEAQVASIMTAYNSVNGAYCSENDHLLREILKDEWQFQGFVESDWVFGTHDTVSAAEAGPFLSREAGWSLADANVGG